MTHSRSPQPVPVPGPAALRAAILELLEAAGPGKSISPFDAARALVGSDERQWSRLMKPLRAVAVEMAKAGELDIRRKGKNIDPSGFRGVYRLALPNPDAGQDTE
ncbi:MAG: DUF3253 domain-containing protein [Hoeflea sp.]|uniref:DUF3253 domain-containing protein n=1 Tax=Hoeflea sp. TaxID=1940281 RepID=UPI002730FAB0|nr:DUF3253 domain-containing protein [Hoeflea sp.]MDP2120603.1 DUF3253 domain-containing protein [Hoeflea sp.]